MPLSKACRNPLCSKEGCGCTVPCENVCRINVKLTCFKWMNQGSNLQIQILLKTDDVTAHDSKLNNWQHSWLHTQEERSASTPITSLSLFLSPSVCRSLIRHSWTGRRHAEIDDRKRQHTQRQKPHSERHCMHFATRWSAWKQQQSQEGLRGNTSWPLTAIPHALYICSHTWTFSRIACFKKSRKKQDNSESQSNYCKSVIQSESQSIIQPIFQSAYLAVMSWLSLWQGLQSCCLIGCQPLSQAALHPWQEKENRLHTPKAGILNFCLFLWLYFGFVSVFLQAYILYLDWF